MLLGVALVLPSYDLHADSERRARDALGYDGFDAARREGAAMSLDEAVAYARNVRA